MTLFRASLQDDATVSVPSPPNSPNFAPKAPFVEMWQEDIGMGTPDLSVVELAGLGAKFLAFLAEKPASSTHALLLYTRDNSVWTLSYALPIAGWPQPQQGDGDGTVGECGAGRDEAPDASQSGLLNPTVLAGFHPDDAFLFLWMDSHQRRKARQFPPLCPPYVSLEVPGSGGSRAAQRNSGKAGLFERAKEEEANWHLKTLVLTLALTIGAGVACWLLPM